MGDGINGFGLFLSTFVISLYTVFIPCSCQLPPFDPNNFQFAFTPNQTNQQGQAIPDNYIDRRNADGT